MENISLPEPPRKPRKTRTKRENPIPLNQREWLSPRDAADYGNMGLSTLYRDMKLGLIPYTKRGRSTIIKRGAIDARNMSGDE